MKLNIIHFIAFGIVLVLMFIGFVSGDKNTQSKNTVVQTQTTEVPIVIHEITLVPIFQVSSETLYAEYDSNIIAAESKYNDQIILVSGIVDNIGKDILGSTYIVLPGGDFFGVQCMFPKSQNSSIAQLSDGQQVTVKGKVSGKMGNILLKNCELQ